MHNATVVAQRIIARVRHDLDRRAVRTPAGRRAAVSTERSRAQATRSGSPAHRLSRTLARASRARLMLARVGGPERALPVGVAALVLVASILSVAPATGTAAGPGAVAGAATGNTHGAGTAPRLSIGEFDPADVAPAAADGPNGYLEGPPVDAGTPSALSAGFPAASAAAGPPQAQGSQPPDGPFLADGTLLKPVAVDTTVPDGSAKLREYAVRQGDTLTGIASHFGISMMTIWWANDLTSKDALHIGQKLVIPPVSGVVVKVKVGDTLASIATDTGASPDQIASYNGLTDPNVILGQVLVIPGAQGDAIATPAPPAQARSSTASTAGGSSGSSSGAQSTGGTSVSGPSTYGGGRFAWPVPGGYISQYFHYGHWALDIAADWGSPILAAGSGTVTFAGWKSNGGGYQVWISHGSDLYTTYNHMSSVSVGVGESVGRGERIGRVGATGDATGPHLHFEVWVGPVWDGGSRVNPTAYL